MIGILTGTERRFIRMQMEITHLSDLRYTEGGPLALPLIILLQQKILLSMVTSSEVLSSEIS